MFNEIFLVNMNIKYILKLLKYIFLHKNMKTCKDNIQVMMIKNY